MTDEERQEMKKILVDSIYNGEIEEAISQISFNGGEAFQCGPESLRARRVAGKGEWETLCVMFYDAWLDGEDVPQGFDPILGELTDE